MTVVILLREFGNLIYYVGSECSSSYACDSPMTSVTCLRSVGHMFVGFLAGLGED